MPEGKKGLGDEAGVGWVSIRTVVLLNLRGEANYHPTGWQEDVFTLTESN